MNRLKTVSLWLVLWLAIGCNLPLVIVPPTPTPIDPAPIAEIGNRVLIVYESSQVQNYPPQQQAILSSTRLRKYLNDTCVKDATGQPEYRILDQHTEFTGGDDGVWPKAMEIQRDSLPWIVVSNGKRGISAPLPPTIDETIALGNKYFD